MYIKKIFLENFGKHERLSWDVEKGVNIICGENGSGKTTIMSGLYLALLQDYLKDKFSFSNKSIVGKDWRKVFLKNNRNLFENTTCVVDLLFEDKIFQFKASIPPISLKEIKKIKVPPTSFQLTIFDKNNEKLQSFVRQEDIAFTVTNNLSPYWYSVLPYLFITQNFLVLLPLTFRQEDIEEICKNLYFLENYEKILSYLIEFTSPSKFLQAVIKETDMNLISWEQGRKHYENQIKILDGEIDQWNSFIKELRNEYKPIFDEDLENDVILKNFIKELELNYAHKAEYYDSVKLDDFLKKKLQPFKEKLKVVNNLIKGLTKNLNKVQTIELAINTNLSNINNKISVLEQIVKKYEDIFSVENYLPLFEEELQRLKNDILELNKISSDIENLKKVNLNKICPMCLSTIDTNRLQQLISDLTTKKDNILNKYKIEKNLLSEEQIKQAKDVLETTVNKIKSFKSDIVFLSKQNILPIGLLDYSNNDLSGILIDCLQKYRIQKKIFAKCQNLYEIVKVKSRSVIDKLKMVSKKQNELELMKYQYIYEKLSGFIQKNPDATLSDFLSNHQTNNKIKFEETRALEKINQLKSKREETYKKLQYNIQISSYFDVVINPLKDILKTKLPKLIIETFIKKLVSETNLILRQAEFDKTAEPTIQLLYEKEFDEKINDDKFVFLAKITKKSSFGIDTDKLFLSQLSSGERAFLSMAIFCALYKIVNIQIPFLFLDEPTQCLDSKNINKLAILINYLIDSGINQIFIITHHKELVENLNNVNILFL